MDEKREIDSLRYEAGKLVRAAERGARADVPERALDLARFIWEGYERDLEYARSATWSTPDP